MRVFSNTVFSNTAAMSRRLPLILGVVLATLAPAQTRTQDVIYLKSGARRSRWTFVGRTNPTKRRWYSW